MQGPKLRHTFATPHHCNCLLQVGDDLLLYGMYEHVSDTNRFGDIRGLHVRPTGVEDVNIIVDERPARAERSRPGIFDMAWVHDEDGCRSLLVSQTDGSVGVSRFAEGKLIAENLYKVSSEMITSATTVGTAADGLLACTAHLGGVHTVDKSSGTIVSSWAGHEYDAWASTFHQSSGLLWTGGDDGFLRSWDLRAAPPTAVSSKRHDAGVVCILAERDTKLNHEHWILTGSYDEKLRILDVRQMKREVAELNVGGGAWRCRRLDSSADGTPSVFVVAAMQGGATFVQVNSSTGEMMPMSWQSPSDEGASATHFAADTPETLVYDVAVLGPKSVATCSFYENTIAIWDV